jgi:hypothetical protein
VLSIGLVLLISIDLILLTYGKYKFYFSASKSMYITFKKNFEMQRALTSTTPIVENNSDSGDDIILKKNWFKKAFSFIAKWLVIIIVVLFVIIIVLITLGIATSSIWGTILLAIYKNFVYAATFLLGVRLFFFFIGLAMHKMLMIDNSVTKRVLIMDTIQFSMLILLLYFAAFGFPIMIIDMVTIPYEWDITFNNLLSIMFPMVFFSIVTVNIMAVLFRLKNGLTKDRNRHKIIRLHQLLFIFISFCYVGILYISDIDLTFINELERTMYLQTLEAVKWIVTSVFIPLFLYTLNNLRKPIQSIEKSKTRPKRHHFNRSRGAHK